MSDTLKHAGAACPKCREPYCAEFAQKGHKPRWSCSCGAGGDLIGEVAGATPPAQGTAGKTVHEAPPGIFRSRT